MAAIGSWDKDIPSSASQIRHFPALYTSDKSALQAAFEDEHYFDDGSSSSAGQHKLGSARVWSGASSAVSSSGRSGGLMWDETNSQLVAVHVATTTRLPSLAAANTWAEAQTFGSTIEVTGATTLSSTLDVTGDTTLVALALSGGFTVGGSVVITTGKVLQNVTANASIVNAGTFATARIPNLAATKITAGTFASGNFVFPDDLTVQGDLAVSGALTVTGNITANEFYEA